MAKKPSPASSRRSSSARSRSGAKSSTLQTSAWSSFDAANRSTTRGWIYFPTLDTAKELDSYSHWELVKKARWFYANSGFARRAVNGLANMIGFLTPRALTRDPVWNELAMRNFESRAGSAQICDLMGKHNFYDYQLALSRNELKDGDMITALSKTASGGAAFLGYEAHQIGNSSLTDADVWSNGVLSDRFGRHLAYRIISGSGHYDIAASDAIYTGDFERLNQPRGITGFAHAINHLHDITDITRDVKLGIKVGNQIGFYRTRPGQKNTSSANRRMGAGRNQQTPDPTIPAAKVDLEEIFRSGKVPDLTDGEELRTLLDTRPHPNQMSLIDFLVRDMSLGFGVAPEVLTLAGSKNSVANRMVLSDAEKWVDQKQGRLADRFCTRYWVYHVACEMKAGRLPKCKDPEWWKVGWIPQKRLTVDRSKDGKLSIDLHKAGMITLARHYDEQFSQDWKPNCDQWMDELAYLRDGLKTRGFQDMSEVQLLLGAPNVKVTEQAQPDELQHDGKNPPPDDTDETPGLDDSGEPLDE
jgi:capsid protein